MISFNGFHLDLTNQQLRRDDLKVVALTPKALALLHHFALHPGRLVLKDELIEAVWPKRYGGDAVLKVCVGEIRKALGDDCKTPRFLETVHRRGYRFIARVTSPDGHTADNKDPAAIPTVGVDSSVPDLCLWSASPRRLVGRQKDMARLGASLASALQGNQQIVFVTGETGIGKSALVDTFIHQVTASGEILATYGQCAEHHAEGSAYLPMLEAVSRLCQQAPTNLVSLLRDYAPSWLSQMPWIGNASQREEVVRERMPLELAEALQAVTAQKPLVLVLDDLQWSDYATLALLSFLARRRVSARLLVIGSYRSEDAWLLAHPIRAVTNELEIHHQCTELALGFLDSDAAAEYLCYRLGGRITAELVRTVIQYSSGNPLFVVRMVDSWLAQGSLRQIAGEWTLQTRLVKTSWISDSIRQMIEKKLTRLGRWEQRVLEAASVAGMKFSVAAVAAALNEDMVEIETWCDRIARYGLFLRPLYEPWPNADRRHSQRFAFIHAIYRHTLCERVSNAHRAVLRQRFSTACGERYANTFT